MTDDEFLMLSAHVAPEVLHAFALTVYDAGYSDGADTTPQIAMEADLARFVERVAIEHGSRAATRQRTEAPSWLIKLQDPE